MSANGRGSMRAQSRSPPFIVIGLSVALVILGANYWNLSSNNSKLAFEVAELQDQVRQVSAKRISAEKKIDSMAESYNRNKETLAQKESDVKSLNGQVEGKLEELQSLGKEKETCQNNLKNCEENSNGIQQELQKVKEEVEQLKKKEQEAATNTQKCDSVCADMRKMIIDAVEKTMGINAVQTLHQAGVDVGEYKDKIGSLSQGQAQQPQKPVVNEANSEQKPAQPQGGEKLDTSINNQPGQGAADPNSQQPSEGNALPQGQIKPQAGQGEANVLPAAQVQPQLNPEPKTLNPDQAAIKPLENLIPSSKQQESNIIPPAQSNPDLPNPQVNQQVPPPGNTPQEQGDPKVPDNHDNNPPADADDQVQQPGQMGATTAKPVTSGIQNLLDKFRNNIVNPIFSNSSSLGVGNFHKSLALKAGEIAKQNFLDNSNQFKKGISNKTLVDQVDPKTADQGQADAKKLGQGQADKKTLGQGQADPREAGKEEVSAEVNPVGQTAGKMVEMSKSKGNSKPKISNQTTAMSNKQMAGQQAAKDKVDYDDYDDGDDKKTGGKGDGKKMEDDYEDDPDVGDNRLKFIPGNEKEVKAADDSIDTLEKKLKNQDQQK